MNLFLVGVISWVLHLGSYVKELLILLILCLLFSLFLNISPIFNLFFLSSNLFFYFFSSFLFLFRLRLGNLWLSSKHLMFRFNIYIREKRNICIFMYVFKALIGSSTSLPLEKWIVPRPCHKLIELLRSDVEDSFVLLELGDKIKQNLMKGNVCLMDDFHLLLQIRDPCHDWMKNLHFSW